MEDYIGKKITIMGLGLNGGGMAAAKFFASKGAKVTVTDLRSAQILKPSMDMLSDYDIRYVLEKHEMSDFENADIGCFDSLSQIALDLGHDHSAEISFPTSQPVTNLMPSDSRILRRRSISALSSLKQGMP